MADTDAPALIPTRQAMTSGGDRIDGAPELGRLRGSTRDLAECQMRTAAREERIQFEREPSEAFERKDLLDHLGVIVADVGERTRRLRLYTS